jgi:hypothetical protein
LWSTWASGVLRGIGAPINAITLDVLWAWSVKESGLDVMRWLNPLNTSWYLPGAQPMNHIPIWLYATLQDGIDATVLTLLQPQYYSVIRANLRGSVPRAQWGNACADLGVWGTGCDWLQANYGAPPGSSDMLTPQENKALVIVAYLAGGVRTPETQKTIDEWAAKMNGLNTDAIIAQLVNSPEFVARRLQENAVIAAGPATPGGPGPAGPPGPSGPPGKDGVVPPGTSFTLSLTGKTT